MIVTVMTLLMAVTCSGCDSTEPSPSLRQQLQTALDEVFLTCDGQGISAAVILPGEDIWLGTVVAEGAVPMVPDNLFWIASITKTYTATVVLQLIEEGVLHFEDQLHQFLPTYAFVDSSITIRQLLNHTSGVADFPNHPQYDAMIDEDENRIWTPEEIVTRMFFEPYCAPGERWRYSSGGYTLLGMVIEAVTGNLVSEEFRTRIYEPIGLENTFLDCQDTITGEFASAWDYDDDLLIEFRVEDVERYAQTSVAFTSGGLFSTAEDVALFIHALFSRKEVIGQAMLDEMLDFITDLPVDFGWLGSGMGTAIFRPEMVNGAYAIGSAGQGAMFISATAYLPECDATVTVLLNSQNWALWEQAMAALCQVVMENVGS
ncbi:serine hydrolase domain-containing protein [Candidatus Zixiibacteriota bacterium]